MRVRNLVLPAIILCLASFASAADNPAVDLGAPFGSLPLIDEVDCGVAPDAAHEFKESAAGVSQVKEILGRPCRMLPTAGEPKYFAYLLGKGKGLKAGAAYVLAIDYPEDQPRIVFVSNRGCETNLGFATGSSLGDTVYGYTNNNSESLKYPLTNQYQTWRQFFHMHDKLPDVQGIRDANFGRPYTPADGFWVVIAQASEADCPGTAGAAVAKIRLFEVPQEEKLAAKYTPVPAGLPQRHLFWREEMADGVLDGDETKRGVTNRTDWYEFKAKLMRFLGMNTFSKDLLEFGANQGWDSTIYGGDEWVYQAPPDVRRIWEDVLTMLGKYDYYVLPMYEYTGGKGNKSLGHEKRAKTLGGKDTYTHISWVEISNADLTDPDTYKDFQKVLDATILRYKDKVKFMGAWLRPRPSGMPIGFGDATLARFAKEANDGKAVTRDELKADKALLGKYYAWWFTKRRDFNVAMKDYLREKGVADAVVMFGCDGSEPGWSLVGPKAVVTDDVPTWTKLIVDSAKTKSPNEPGGPPTRVLSYDDVVRDNLYYKSLITMGETWDDWEWNHAQPQADPQNYKQTDGAMLTYSFNRAYTVSSPTGFEAFRTPDGLAIMGHHALNENMMTIWAKDAKDNNALLGYFACDVERNGPYCMLGEARAMAYGDPRYIGYLSGHNYSRGFPQYVREFNTAFLSLPALPSKVLDGAASDKDVIVRQIATEKNGTYLAVVNVALTDKKDITITLPATGKVTNAVTGEAIAAEGGKVTLSFHPCHLIALHVDGQAAASAPATTKPAAAATKPAATTKPATTKPAVTSRPAAATTKPAVRATKPAAAR